MYEPWHKNRFQKIDVTMILIYILRIKIIYHLS